MGLEGFMCVGSGKLLPTHKAKLIAYMSSDTREWLPWIRLTMLSKLGVGPQIHVVILVEGPHRTLNLELTHHQLNDVRRDGVRQLNAVVLLQRRGPA